MYAEQYLNSVTSIKIIDKCILSGHKNAYVCLRVCTYFHRILLLIYISFYELISNIGKLFEIVSSTIIFDLTIKWLEDQSELYFFLFFVHSFIIFATTLTRVH